jgi:hypothetical protein
LILLFVSFPVAVPRPTLAFNVCGIDFLVFYLTPMVSGVLASVVTAVWFDSSGVRNILWFNWAIGFEFIAFDGDTVNGIRCP